MQALEIRVGDTMGYVDTSGRNKPIPHPAIATSPLQSARFP